MENSKNKTIAFSKEDCESTANELYYEIAGLNGKQSAKNKRLMDMSKDMKEHIDNRIDCKVVYSCFDDFSLVGRDLKVGGAKFTCPAFEQINPETVSGVCVYAVTSGDFHLENEEIMQQLLADFWGTAFVDAARMKFEEELSGIAYLSNSFGPGLYGMQTNQMHEICKLIEFDKIDVEVKESGLLVPVKSCGGLYILSDKPIESIDTECEGCLGTVKSCNICNVSRLKKMKNKSEMNEPGEGKRKTKTSKKNERKENKMNVDNIKNNDSKAFVCTGICSKCGRCKNGGMISGANKRKTKLIALPADFKPEEKNQGYGIAYDIGTTTVVGILLDLYTGKELGAVAKTNPQNAHGLDVISRITFAMEDEKNLKLLRDSAVKCLNQIADELCAKFGVDKTAIIRATVAGNTTMAHLFTGHNPASLALAPFAPAYTGTLMLDSKTSGLEIGDEAAVIVFPNIAGHVGGDITAGILAARLLDETKLTLFLDIGTNGEIVLTDGTRMLACSTAAGPAFEGAAIYQGMRAAAGAIEKVEISEGKVLFSTIENKEPVGICGSGLIDAVAQMLRAGLIEKSGRIITAKDYMKKIYANKDGGEELASGGKDSEEKFAARLRVGKNCREFVLVFKEHSEDIVITQKDIRQVQLAKGAISAGISIMLDKLGKKVEDIEKVVIAGAFGNFIDKESAVAIGLLPSIDLEKIHSAGNTAGTGTLMAVASAAEAITAKSIPDKVEHIELADIIDFQEKYLAAMSFTL